MRYIYERSGAANPGSLVQGQIVPPKQIPLEYLPDGTALEVLVGLIPHQGVLERTWNGEPLVHQNSKEHGKAVTTSFSEFSGGRPVSVLHIPRTAEESHQITQSARRDVVRGIPWTVGDNCQDFVSRAVTGKNGSKTRDAMVVGGLFGLVLWLASR
jgi:hypothetical protein